MLHDPVQDGVRAQVGVDPQVPLVGLELGRDQCGAPALPCLQYLEEVHRVCRVLHRRGEEVVDDEQARLRELVEGVVEPALGPCDVDLAEHVVEADVAHGEEPAARGDAQGLGQIALAPAALGDDDGLATLDWTI